MEIYGAEESLECAAADVVAKKIEASIPLHHQLFGKCVRYSCTRDGLARITKELNPKESLCNNPLSKKNLGDTLKANSFDVLVKGFKAIKTKKVHWSGAHNANEMSTKDYTFAEITIPFSAGFHTSLNLPRNYISPIKLLTKKA